MNKIFLYLLIITNLFFFTSYAISKVVGDRIVIGATIPLTGEDSSETNLFQDQFNQAIESINSKGGVNAGGRSYQLEIIYYDNGSSIQRANHLIRRLLLNDGVQFLIVFKDIELSNNTKDLINKYQVPIASSEDAILIYKKAFETLNSVDSKKIKEYLSNFQ